MLVKHAMINFYHHLPASLCPKYHNPGYSKHGIQLPFRMLIAGNSGSMKTNTLLNLIQVMSGTFDYIWVITRNAEEPLYQFLASKIPEGQCSILEGIESIPDLDSLDPAGQHLIVFDDLVLEKRQSQIEEYFIRARKVAKGVSCVYLSQNYFRTPKTIRVNCSYIILKKLSSTRDLGMILNDYSLGISKKDLLAIYQQATQRNEDFLLVDINKSAFRLNFDTNVPR